MNILISTDSFPPQIIGSSYACYNLALGLAKKDHKVSVICPSDKYYSYQDKIDGILIFRISSIPIPYIKNIRFSLFPLNIPKIIKSISPDIIHIQHPFFIGQKTLTYAKKFKIPIVTTNHLLPETFLMFIPKMGSSVISKILNPSWKFVIKFCNKCNFVTAPTETAVELLKMHGLKVKYQAVSNGIDTDRFKPREKNKNLIEKFYIPDLPIVLYTGRISEEKQIHTLIQAIPEILKKVNCHFVICGDGPVRAQLENMVLDLKIKDKVSFLGFLTEKDLPFIYNLADVYVMPSICELQSITTLEALASALPVVACNKYALKELVLDGKNGFLFKPADTNDLSEKITKILLDEELRERMKKESLKIVKKHSLENTIKQYEEIYLNLINFKNYST